MNLLFLLPASWDWWLGGLKGLGHGYGWLAFGFTNEEKEGNCDEFMEESDELFSFPYAPLFRAAPKDFVFYFFEMTYELTSTMP